MLASIIKASALRLVSKQATHMDTTCVDAAANGYAYPFIVLCSIKNAPEINLIATLADSIRAYV